LSSITTNTNSTMMAPAYTMISSAPTNGAPRVKNTTATARSERMRWSSACTTSTAVSIRTVARTAMAPAR